VISLIAIVASLAAGCGGESGSEELSVDVSFAPGVPRAARDDAIRVEVYLVGSCDSVVMGDRPNDALDSMFVLRDGSAGPAIGIPEPGQYGLYAVAQDSNCAVVGAACDEVTIDGALQASYSVELGAFSGEGCFANQQCSIETGECTGPSGECVDLDADGLGDGTLDNVGCVDATTDSNDGEATVCADTDGDSCDDCSSGAFDPNGDGPDDDADGICDSSDACVDSDADGLGDGSQDNVGCVNPTTDSNDDDGAVCADTDGDGCDDCSGGAFDPNGDGLDDDADGICDSGDVCVDSDGDGLGNGTLGNAGCVDPTTDSNDGDGAVCADTDGDSCDDCSSGSFDALDDGPDADSDGICDAGDVCVDSDGDGLGDGTGGNVGCASTTTDSNVGVATICADTDGDGCDDCSTGSFDPLDDGVDSDADGICDSGDDCVDADGDGLGDGTMGNAGCVDTTTDSNDGDGSVCADTDGDSCDDCAVAAFDPSNDGLDADGDGACALGDCDDGKPLCASVCTDLDDDGYCVDTDCNDVVPSCDLDCTTNSDGGPHVNCFENFCGSDPADSESECLEVSDVDEYDAAIDAANNNPGPDYIVLNDFTMTTGVRAINDDTGGLTIRQVAGATLTVNSGGKAFELKTANNLIDGVHVNGLNGDIVEIQDIVEISADNNTVQNCVFEGFERRGIFVNGGNNAQILHNIITGGTDAQGDDKGAIIVKDSTGSVVAGNTVALNAMDGVQIRKVIGIFVDHNTIADNGGSGLEFYGDDSSNVCVRNNNVTRNGDFGINVEKAPDPQSDLFDTSSSCTAPLSSGPAYGNNDFENTGGGSFCSSECLACACLPAGSFWEYSVDPLYTSTTAGDQDLYCLGASSTLIDGGDDLLSYDLNGDAAGDFNGSSPDIGSREDGPGDCN
jgi:hypothetical protein